MPQKKERGLTPKQAAFVREYLIDLNATQAAIRAGYSAKTAQVQSAKMLSKAIISAALKEKMDERARKAEISAEYVLSSLLNVAERCQTAVPVLDKEGNETGEWKFDSSGANRALELIGKHLGIFVERVKHEGNVFGLTINASGPPPKQNGE